MKFTSACLVLVCCLATTAFAADLEVTVSRSDLNRAANDRYFCCLIAQASCTSQCSGQSCTATCTGKCGLFGLITCGPYTCSAIASSTCTTTTTTTTTTAAATT